MVILGLAVVGGASWVGGKTIVQRRRDARAEQHFRQHGMLVFSRYGEHAVERGITLEEVVLYGMKVGYARERSVIGAERLLQACNVPVGGVLTFADFLDWLKDVVVTRRGAKAITLDHVRELREQFEIDTK